MPLSITLIVAIAGAFISVGILYNQVDVLADDVEEVASKIETHAEPRTHASNQADHEAIIILQNDLEYIQKAVDQNGEILREIAVAVRK